MVSSNEYRLVGRPPGCQSPYYVAMGLMYVYDVELLLFDKPGQLHEIRKVIP